MRIPKRILAIVLSIILCASICFNTTYNAYATVALPEIAMTGWEAFVAFCAALGIAIPTVGIMDEGGLFDQEVLNEHEDELLAEYNATIGALAQARYETGTSPTVEDGVETLKDQFSVMIGGGGTGNKRPKDADLINFSILCDGLYLAKDEWLANMKASEYIAKNSGSISVPKSGKFTKEELMEFIKTNYPNCYNSYNLVIDIEHRKEAFEDFDNYPYKLVCVNSEFLFMLSSVVPIYLTKGSDGYFIYSPTEDVIGFKIRVETGECYLTTVSHIVGSSKIYGFDEDHIIFCHNLEWGVDLDCFDGDTYEGEYPQETIFEYPEEFPESQSDEDEWTVYAPQEVPDGDTFTIGNTDSNKILETANEANAKNGSALAKLQRAIGISTGIRSSGGHTVTNVDGSTSSPDDLVETISQARIDAGLENEPSPDPSPEPDPAENENGDLGDFSLPSGLADITDKFPFCIPFDLVDCFSGLYSDTRKAPVWTADIEFPSIDYTLKFSVDMSDYDEYIEIFREGEFVVFIIGLMFATGKLINWEAAS